MIAKDSNEVRKSQLKAAVSRDSINDIQQMNFQNFLSHMIEIDKSLTIVYPNLFKLRGNLKLINYISKLKSSK